jgi:hypothetical protein
MHGNWREREYEKRVGTVSVAAFQRECCISLDNLL